MDGVTLTGSFEPPVLVTLEESGRPIEPDKVATTGLLSSHEETGFSGGMDIP